jgi:hypothetical protein
MQGKPSSSRRPAVLLALATLLVGLHCGAGSPKSIAQEAGRAEKFEPDWVEVHLVVLYAHETILVTPPYVPICRNPTVACPGEVRWTVRPPLRDGEVLIIERKEGEPECFEAQPFRIPAGYNSVVSGPPICEDEEVWHYRVWVEREVGGQTETIAQVDPGVIFR